MTDPISTVYLEKSYADDTGVVWKHKLVTHHIFLTYFPLII